MSPPSSGGVQVPTTSRPCVLVAKSLTKNRKFFRFRASTKPPESNCSISRVGHAVRFLDQGALAERLGNGEAVVHVDVEDVRRQCELAPVDDQAGEMLTASSGWRSSPPRSAAGNEVEGTVPLLDRPPVSGSKAVVTLNAFC